MAIRDVLNRSDRKYTPGRSGIDNQDDLSFQRCEVIGLAIRQLSLQIIESGHVSADVGSEGTRGKDGEGMIATAVEERFIRERETAVVDSNEWSHTMLPAIANFPCKSSLSLASRASPNSPRFLPQNHTCY